MGDEVIPNTTNQGRTKMAKRFFTQKRSSQVKKDRWMLNYSETIRKAFVGYKAIDWNTATHLFNQGLDSDDAAKRFIDQNQQ